MFIPHDSVVVLESGLGLKSDYSWTWTQTQVELDLNLRVVDSDLEDPSVSLFQVHFSHHSSAC